LEVIICTGLVAVMIVPIASVIRASSQSIAQSQGSTSTSADLRRGLSWVGDSLRDGALVAVTSRRLTLQLNTGDTVRIEVVGGDLVLDDGTVETTIVENVRDVRFALQNQVSPPNKPIGLTMSLRARDSLTSQLVTVNSTIALPPQI
jgi:hypothetical protein